MDPCGRKVQPRLYDSRRTFLYQYTFQIVTSERQERSRSLPPGQPRPDFARGTGPPSEARMSLFYSRNAIDCQGVPSFGMPSVFARVGKWLLFPAASVDRSFEVVPDLFLPDLYLPSVSHRVVDVSQRNPSLYERKSIAMRNAVNQLCWTPIPYILRRILL